jgi:hypothetical protein
MSNPEITSEEEKKQAGDEIDAALAHKAAQNGMSKLLILLPDNFPSVK